jgi:uncharacterized membrane protein
MPVNIFNTVDDPSAIAGTTQAFGVNDTDQIVGEYQSIASFTHGFLESGGTYTTLDAPSAINTSAQGINSAGQIVGFYGTNTGGTGPFEAASGPFGAVPNVP